MNLSLSSSVKATISRCFALVMLALLASACAGASVQSEEPLLPTPSQLRAAQLGPTSTASATVQAQPTAAPPATLVPIPTPAESERLAGPAQAPVELLLYTDFDCSLCQQAYDDISAVLERHSQEVTYSLRLYPLLGVHDKSAQAAAAFIAASQYDLQAKMYNQLFDRRDEWADLSPAAFREWLLDISVEFGVDQVEFADHMSKTTTLAAIEEAYTSALASGIPGVPFLIINNEPYLLNWSQTNLEASVRLALLQENQYSSPPEPIGSDSLPNFGQFEFDMGIVKFQLFPKAAPTAIRSFTFLAEEGWYSNTALYLVQPGNLVMGGDPTDTGLGNAGYYFEIETNPAYQFDQAGIIAIDNDGPASNSSRFIITLQPRPDLNGAYTIIGRITEGLELLQDLSSRDPLADLLDPPEATLERITFEGQ